MLNATRRCLIHPGLPLEAVVRPSRPEEERPQRPFTVWRPTITNFKRKPCSYTPRNGNAGLWWRSFSWTEIHPHSFVKRCTRRAIAHHSHGRIAGNRSNPFGFYRCGFFGAGGGDRKGRILAFSGPCKKTKSDGFTGAAGNDQINAARGIPLDAAKAEAAEIEQDGFLK